MVPRLRPGLVDARARSGQVAFLLVSAQATKASIRQWIQRIDTIRVECHGPFNTPEQAAEYESNQGHDLELIRHHAPHLLEGLANDEATPTVNVASLKPRLPHHNHKGGPTLR